jgi:hypothetical protein
VQITWTRCRTYAEARDRSRMIYLHEWHGKPFYWGRYNSGYRHWIDGCLLHGATLYIGQLDAEALAQVDVVETFLIRTYGHVMNRRIAGPVSDLQIKHCGDVPGVIRQAARINQR